MKTAIAYLEQDGEQIKLEALSEGDLQIAAMAIRDYRERSRAEAVSQLEIGTMLAERDRLREINAELVAALELFNLNYRDGYIQGHRTVLRHARKALAKAKGE